MQIIQGKDYDEMSRKAANIISAQVILKPNCVLGLATGSTPLGAYANLINWYEKGDLDFSNVSSVNLDEYRGLPADNDQSYRYFMKTNLFDKINIDQSRTHVPNGMEPDSNKACHDHDAIIEELGGIDLQLLGLGLNGHIGLYHGNPVHYAGKENLNHCKRGKQSGNYRKSFLRTGYAGSSCFYFANAS